MPFPLLVIISTTLDAAVVSFVLFYRWERFLDRDREPTITAFRVLLAALAVTGVFVFKIPALIVLGLNAFGLVFLIYTDLAVAFPLIALVVLCMAWRGPSGIVRPISTGARNLALVCSLFVPVAIYATFYEPFNLKLERAEVPLEADRTGREPLTIGVLADIQTSAVTAHEHAAVDRIMAEAPDLILMPGDLFQGDAAAFERELPALRKLLGKLRAPGGVYFTLGDIDREERVRRAIRGTEVRLLVNETVSLSVRDRQLTLVGLEMDVGSEEARRAIHSLEESASPDDIRILLSHYPDSVLLASQPSRIDLIVAGHTHGGQVSLPLFGPPITLSGVPRRVAGGGLEDLGGRRIYVSRGIGTERGQAPRIRFLCPPEIALLGLR